MVPRKVLALVCTMATGMGTTGCEPNKPAPSQEDCFFGDKAEQPVVELVFRGTDNRVMPLPDNGTVPLIVPPQGGHVLLIGVRARNMDVCRLTVNAAVRDPCTNHIIGREGRPVELIPTGEMATPRHPAELANYANIPVCPNVANGRNGFGVPYRLEVRATDRSGRNVTRTIMFTPDCAGSDDEPFCRCECAANYVVGRSCANSPSGEETGGDAKDPSACPGVDDAEGDNGSDEEGEGEGEGE